MKNLVKEYLKRKFFENKGEAIEDYANFANPTISVYQYTKGKKVIIEATENKAYSQNGYFFSVILKDDSYIDYLLVNKKEEVLEYLDSALAEDYETETEADVEEEKESE